MVTENNYLYLKIWMIIKIKNNKKHKSLNMNNDDESLKLSRKILKFLILHVFFSLPRALHHQFSPEKEKFWRITSSDSTTGLISSMEGPHHIPLHHHRHM